MSKCDWHVYETDFTKGVYKLEDFCNALKDNNCIIDTLWYYYRRKWNGTSSKLEE